MERPGTGHFICPTRWPELARMALAHKGEPGKCPGWNPLLQPLQAVEGDTGGWWAACVLQTGCSVISSLRSAPWLGGCDSHSGAPHPAPYLPSTGHQLPCCAVHTSGFPESPASQGGLTASSWGVRAGLWGSGLPPPASAHPLLTVTCRLKSGCLSLPHSGPDFLP